MYLRNAKGQFKSKKMLKYIGIVWAVALFMAGLANAARVVADWGAENQLVFDWPIHVTFSKIVKVVKREQEVILSPLAEEVISTTEHDLSPVEQKIVDKWGVRYGYIAVAIFRCESGLRNDAVNWGSGDVGIAQIHVADWLDDAEREFGYTLVDLFDADKNLDVAYYIWDIDNGVLGDNIGSFNDWVVFNNHSYIGCME